MSKKIASLYAEIGADDTKLKSALKETKSGLEGAKAGFAGFTKVIGIGVAAVGTFAGVWTKAMDLGKQGAELDFTRDKFDKLSKSIGVTSDTLLGDLKRATGGLRSDAELVASATDFMALGFAKTRDEAVRLTTVAGALNMDMNQLVLTLANQTTMRFDQLGVAVDGFDEKVAKLKTTGMDANAAFKEAFLQQAEEQINKVGNAADSAVAPFMRLETATNNLVDAGKKKLAPFLASAADAMLILLTRADTLTSTFNKHSGEMANTADTYKDYIEEMRRAAKLLGLNIVEGNGQIHVLNGVGVGAQDVTDKYEILNQAQFEYNKLAGGVVTANQDVAASSDAVAQAAQDAANAIAEQAGKMQADLVDATHAVQNAQQDWMKGAGSDVADALKEAGLKGQDYRTALGLIDEAYGTGLGIQQDYKDDVAQLAKNYKDGKITGDEFKTALGEMKDEYLPLNEEVQKANQQLFDLQLKWLWFQQNNKLNMEVNIKQNGSLPGQPGDAPAGVVYKDTSNGGTTDKRAAGGPVSMGMSYLVGERGPEMFTPRQSGVITPNDKLGGITIQTMTVIANNPTEFMAQLGRMARQKSRAGAASIGA